MKFEMYIQIRFFYSFMSKKKKKKKKIVFSDFKKKEYSKNLKGEGKKI